MASRGMENSGGELHIRMVKETIKMIADRFSTMNRIMIQFEPFHSVTMNFHENRYEKLVYTPTINFRPDILLTHTPPEKRKADSKGFYAARKFEDNKVWESILDSTHIILEVETTPKAIFRNKLKLAYYAKLKDERDRRSARLQYAIVLVVPKGSKLPDDTAPFDEIWVVGV